VGKHTTNFKKINCSIEFVQMAELDRLDQFKSSILDGQPVCDLFALDEYYVTDIVANNYILSYEDFLPENADIYLGERYVQGSEKILGRNVIFKERRAPINGWLLGVNLDIIDAVGAENPVELYDSGEWTWEKFREICKYVTRDTDGDGEPDIWGYCGTPQTLALCLIASNSGFLLDPETITQQFDTPNTIDALQFLNELYTVDKVCYSVPNSGGIMYSYNWNKNVFMNEANSVFFSVLSWMLPEKLPYKFAVIDHPKGPRSTDDYTYSYGLSGLVIPSGAKDPEYIYKIYEEMQYWWGNDEDLLYKSERDYLIPKFYDEEDIERTIRISGNAGKLDFINNMYINGDTLPISYIAIPVIIGEKTVDQAIDENKFMLEQEMRSNFPNDFFD